MVASAMLELLALIEAAACADVDAPDVDIELPDAVDMELLLPFFSIGGRLKLSLLEDERLLGSFDSMSCTILLMCSASGHDLAILCKRAVVEDVLKRPRARRRSPWLRQASTAPQSEVTELLSSCTYFLVTASSISCFTSFLTLAMSRSL